MGIWQVWLLGLGASAALTIVTWVASLVRRDASLVDRVWGLAFVVVAWAYVLVGDATGTRAWLVVALVTVWGVRLSLYLTWRNWGKGEDRRYADMRAKRPDTFAVRSLVAVFLLQGALAWLISLPVLGAILSGDDGTLGWLDAIGIALWVVGVVFEAGGDWQLSRFLTEPSNRGKVMDRGLWRYTRHPNYFGDTVVWWSYAVFSLAAGAWWGIAGSLLMTVLIIKVSGVALTDRNMRGQGRKREGYDDYVQRTNAFVPGPRKR